MAETSEQKYRVVHHVAEAIDGSLHRRVSIHRRYTHAVTACTENGWAVVSWHEDSQGAEKSIQDVSRMRPDIQVGIVPVSRQEQLETETAA